MALIQYLAIQTEASGVLSDSGSLAHIFPWASVVSVELISVNYVSNSTFLSMYPCSLQEAVENNEVTLTLLFSKVDMPSAPPHRIYLPILSPAFLSSFGCIQVPSHPP